jgi:hypothetical protein
MKTWVQELLKKILGNGFLVLLIVAIFYILYLRECKRSEPCPAKDEVIVKKDIWDSMIALADKPPIIHIDTIYQKGDTVFIDNFIPMPVIDSKDTTIKYYHDALTRKDINVSVDLKIKGTLLNRKWQYTPVITFIREVDSIFVPKPYPIETIVKVPKNGFYGYGTAGGNKSAFLFGGGLDFITKKETLIGYEYQRFGSTNIHSIKTGIKLFNNK